VPKDILLKPSRLTAEEFDVVRSHAISGYELLEALGCDEIVLSMTRHHHERQDGSGYPDGLNAAEIPEYVSALSACDCFDALTSDRPYRAALSVEEAFAILTAEATDGKLDPTSVLGLNRALARVAPGMSHRNLRPFATIHEALELE